MLKRCLALLIVLSPSCLGAESLLLMEENHETRQRFKQFLEAPPGRLPGSYTIVYSQRADGRRVVFQMTTRGESIYYLYLDEETGGTGRMIHRGNVSIKRHRQDGSYAYMTILARDHPGSYIRIYPSGDRSFLDVYLFHVPLYRRVNLALSFESLLTSPLSRIINLTRDRIDWSLIFHRGKSNRALQKMVSTIREQLPLLADLDDGAYDSSGLPVSIEEELASEGGMNCSGFAKWVVDGLFYPVSESYTDIEKLKEKHLGLRGNRWSERYENERDPFVGLDWSRNLAVQLAEAKGHSGAGLEDFDVRDVDYVAYVEDVGYPVSALQLILFQLARRDPDRFYLGSVNIPFGNEPALRQHTHLVVLFPLFSPKGDFRVVVMERNRETSLDSLEARYGGGHIHLVSLQADESFRPLLVEPLAEGAGPQNQ
jgi:hypothetical protein